MQRDVSVLPAPYAPLDLGRRAYPGRQGGGWPCLRWLCGLAWAVAAAFARADEGDLGLGVYGGPYYDTMPAGFLHGDAHFKDQYMLAITASKTLWRAESLPLSLEIDGMVGQQFGQAAVFEVAVAPVVRWGGFPWNSVLQTDVRLGPLGISYTPSVSPLERDSGGRGSQFLNFLMMETAFSQPGDRRHEVFLRLHHRCTIYDLINDYGANGEDFFGIGYRRYF